MGAASPWNAGKALVPPPEGKTRQLVAPAPITIDRVGADNEIIVPAGVRRINAILIGGGGSGGRGDRTDYVLYPDYDSGGGGGSGAMVNISFDVVPGERYIVRIGRGGDGPGGDTSILRNNIVYATAGGGRPGTSGNPGIGGAGGTPWANANIISASWSEEKGRSGTNSVGTVRGGTGSGFGTSGAEGATSTVAAQNGEVPGGGGGGGTPEFRNGGKGMSGVARITWL